MPLKVQLWIELVIELLSSQSQHNHFSSNVKNESPINRVRILRSLRIRT